MASKGNRSRHALREGARKFERLEAYRLRRRAEQHGKQENENDRGSSKKKKPAPADDVEDAEAAVLDLEQRLIQAKAAVAGFAMTELSSTVP
jgi:hypothetical protein